MNEIYLLDLLGTLSFAFFGAYVGMQKRFDIFGIITVALLTALGGGTIREIILNHLPFYFSDINYILAVVLGCALSILLYPAFSKIEKYALVVDAVGLVTFAFIGANAGRGLGMVAIIFLATISAVGGGLLRDIAIVETPQIFYRDFYASPAIFLGILYVIFAKFINNPSTIFLLILAAFLLRVFAIYFHIDLWGPWRKNKTEPNS